MYYQRADYNGCFNYRVSTSAVARDEAILILHGFPSQRGHRHKDLAFYLAERLPVDVYVIHHRGLGESPGRFSFSESVRTGISFGKNLLGEGVKRLHLIGHSWGGMIATLLYSELPIEVRGRLTLLSPFCAEPTSGLLKSFAEQVVDDYPHIFEDQNFEEIHQDLLELGHAYPLRARLQSIQECLFQPVILQAIGDEKTPEVQVEAFLQEWGVQVEYEKVQTDHSFLRGRQKILQRIFRIYQEALDFT